MKNDKKSPSLTYTIEVDQTPEQVFRAINDPRAWWAGDFEGPTDVLGAEFSYRYKKMHRSTQKITELVPGKRVAWHVTDSNLDFLRDKSEWNGTDITFDIARKGDKTEVRFTHVGLVPAIECYDACSGAWGFLVKESLRSLIATGKGVPHPGGRLSKAAGIDEQGARGAQQR